MDEFDEKLSQAIDETIRYCLGDRNTQIIYEFLEKQGCPEQEIPEKLDVLVTVLEALVGSGRGQILGAAQILENEILKAFCAKLGIDYAEVGPGYLPEQIRKLKEIYNRRKNTSLHFRFQLSLALRFNYCMQISSPKVVPKTIRNKTALYNWRS